MKIAVFGGTFNPVHNGHIHLLKECCKQYSFNKILLVPTNLPPHKVAKGLASNEHRLNMLKLATQGNSLLEVSDIEFKLGEKSYTINTIIALKKQYENAEFYFIAGSDMLRMFKKWYRYEDILNAVTLIVGARHNSEYNELLELKQNFGALSEKINIINIKPVSVSSTDIRKKVAKGEDILDLADEKVCSYIQKNELYKSEKL